MAKKDKEDKNPKVHDELEGLNIEINSLGEVSSNLDIDKINSFLDENVEDRKLTDRKDNKDKKEKK